MFVLCPFSFGICLVCPSSSYGFRLPILVIVGISAISWRTKLQCFNVLKTCFIFAYVTDNNG
jgi:hypothetical protein